MGKKGDKVLTCVCVFVYLCVCVCVCVCGGGGGGYGLCFRRMKLTVLSWEGSKDNCGSLLQGDMGLNGTKGEKGIDGRSGLPGPKVSISTYCAGM